MLLVGVLLIGLMFAGLAVDGARMFTARRDLQNVADSAALAGASSLDEGVYRASGGGGRPARSGRGTSGGRTTCSARSSLPASVDVDVVVAADRVEVRIARPVRPLFLGLVGIGPEQIGAHASAAPQTG